MPGLLYEAELPAEAARPPSRRAAGQGTPLGAERQAAGPVERQPLEVEAGDVGEGIGEGLLGARDDDIDPSLGEADSREGALMDPIDGDVEEGQGRVRPGSTRRRGDRTVVLPRDDARGGVVEEELALMTSTAESQQGDADARAARGPAR